NALWGPYDYPQEFVTLNRDYYAAHLRKIDLVGAEPVINRWAEERTAGRIRELVPPGTFDSFTGLVLTSAVYFKGRWQDQVRSRATREQPCRVPGGRDVQVPMMRQTAWLRYGRTGAGEPPAKIVELPYQGGRLSMVVILPEKEGVRAVEAALTAQK